MENIRQAVERARSLQGAAGSKPQVRDDLGAPRLRSDPGVGFSNAGGRIREIELNAAHLLSNRIVSYNGTDPRSLPFDMLRTQVLQSMDLKGWKTIGVTSPTPGCGKTLTALNLALSVARQPERSVMLVDFDLRRPRVGSCLGLKPTRGVLDILEERMTFREAIIPVRAGDQPILVLPTAGTKQSSELMASRAMHSLMQDIRSDYNSHVIILDLPPILSSDDVIAILPQIDCVLLVAAVGLSKASEIEECNRHLQSSDIIRIVLNKATDAVPNYYY